MDVGAGRDGLVLEAGTGPNGGEGTASDICLDPVEQGQWEAELQSLEGGRGRAVGESGLEGVEDMKEEVEEGKECWVVWATEQSQNSQKVE